MIIVLSIVIIKKRTYFCTIYNNNNKNDTMKTYLRYYFNLNPSFYEKEQNKHR